MLAAVKAVNASPILGQVLLQLFLRTKESEQAKCQAQLAEQDMICEVRLRDL
jgi:hypothetical protein